MPLAIAISCWSVCGFLWKVADYSCGSRCFQYVADWMCPCRADVCCMM